MNQSKLEVVKQEMARVNVNILVTSELKWTGMGVFNSDDQNISYHGQESLRRNAAGEGNGTHSSTLAWKIPRMEEPGRLQSMGSLRVGHD